jgi:class 3 adenylate cyclase
MATRGGLAFTLMERPQTRYAWNDGASIAFQVFGEGPRDLVLVPSWASQIEHLWDQPLVTRLLRRLASFSRVILFDRRGSGLSDRPSPPPPLEDQMDDVRAVMEAAGSEAAGLLAETEGTALAALFAATHPDLTTALALYCPMPRLVAAPGYEWALQPEARDAFATELVRRWGDGSSIDRIAPSLADDRRIRDWYGRLERLSLSPGAVGPSVRALADTDVRDVLPLIRVPTLVARRRDDQLVDARHARFAADSIPGARYVELPGSDNAVFADDAGALLDELEEFLTGARHGPEPERVLATVLFTDIVASTERAAELGDRRWRDLLEEHDEVVRGALDRFGGTEIKTLGDGFLATFDGPARAIRCALAVVEACESIGVEVRAGLHTGECERVAGDVGGIAVHIAARVIAEAGAGEVLVSRTVTDLVAGSGLGFAPRGTHELKGVPGAWELYGASA